MIYLQQAWRTIEHVVQGDRKYFTIRIDNFTSILTFQRLRLLLDLPLPDSREGKTTFDSYPTDLEMFAGIRALGYVGSLSKMSDFRKSNLPPFYCQFFSVINKCLTSRHSGHDNTNIHTLRLFHAIIYDLHVDYAMAIWTELYEKVLSKIHSKKPKYVPCQSFYNLLFEKQSFDFEMPVPTALLAYADLNAPSVRKYRESMGLPEPETPTQDSEPFSRAESVRVQHTTGVVERESEQRENIERGSGVGQPSVLKGVGTQAQSAMHLAIPTSQPEIAIIPQLGTQEENLLAPILHSLKCLKYLSPTSEDFQRQTTEDEDFRGQRLQRTNLPLKYLSEIATFREDIRDSFIRGSEDNVRALKTFSLKMFTLKLSTSEQKNR
ncbi:hypothetical protein L6452_19202 [Arctium lappa]|uniref:Uncharacterized protein n=1 Tax=Arctium lappa TaxID=4217 RepID=A0ACB9B7D5_ARCLA|nr:hypothetical protein L6452_19202 [Arctium lappa]